MNAARSSPAERGYAKDYYDRAYFADHPGKRRSNAEVVRQLRSSGMTSGPVLDVGVGAGYLLRTLADSGFEVAGMDHAPEALERAAEQTEAELRLGDVCEGIPWPDESFAGVVLHDVIEHLLAPAAALADVRRVLRPGGLVLVSTLNEDSLLHSLLGKRWSYFKDPTHVQMYSVASLVAALESAGLEELRHWTYFDLNKAGETTPWLRPLRSLTRVVHVARRGESMSVLARRPVAAGSPSA